MSTRAKWRELAGRIASAGDGGIFIHDQASLEVVAEIPTSDWVRTLHFVRKAGLLAAGLGNGAVMLVDPLSQEVEAFSSPHSTTVRTIDSSPNGLWLATGSHDSTLALHSIPRLDLVRRITCHTDWVCAVAFNATSTRFVSCSSDRTVAIHSMEPAAVVPLSVIACDVDCCFATFHPQNPRLFAVCLGNGTTMVLGLQISEPHPPAMHRSPILNRG
eukprot:TRINITY_DN6390_c0_g1_i1.p1 TRINITY_DN6390_c0_g1~~TRINITY_DN6390_c0_g1_i1.p1  ORF type:complete len:227 (-),score=29.81 TRINITY_DN6390_c0_g1_i1:536-1183(-)